MLRLPRASLCVFGLALAFACGEKFTGVASPVAGSTQSSAGESDGGAEPNPSEGGRGGKPSVGGGGASAGKGGVPSVAGVSGGTSVAGDGGDVGAGGQPPIDVPPVPTDGLELWLRADDGVSTLPLYTWKDASGHARNATQTALNYRPTLTATALAGKPALVFDGKDDFLELPEIDIDFAAGLSLFIVMQQDATNTCEAYFEASTDSEKNDVHFGDWKDSFNYEIEEDYVQIPEYPVLLNQPQIAVAVQSSDGWVHLRRNGNGAGERKVPLPPLVKRTQVFIAKSLYEGCATFDGSISEVLLYSRGLNDSELLQVEQHLQKKWGCCGGDP